jgi:hypothetical protein
LNAAIKPVRGLWQLDVWRYGWQKRQDRGKKRQRCGKAGGKNGNVVSGCGYVHAILLAAAPALNRQRLAFSGGVQL